MKKKKSEIQIFLAHASEDKPAVLKLYTRLKEAGYKPWLDKKNLIPGQIWRDEIPKAIKNSDIFLACLSSKSANKRGYIQREFRIALDTLGEMPSGTIFFIPMRLEECEIPDLRLSEGGLNLRDIHWLDYWEEEGFEQLERAIAHQFGSWETEKPELIFSRFEVVTVNNQGKLIKREQKQSQYYTENLGNGVTLDMVAVTGGKFMMGTEDEEIERLCKKYNSDWFKCERPRHEVTVQPFFMGKYPITQAEWREIASRTDLKVERDLNPNPSHFKGDDRPVECVSWHDAIEFCGRLSKLTGRKYRLPSEAEWEYACRSVISYQLSVISEESSQNPSDSPLSKGGWGGYYPPFYFGETITGELANYGASSTYADEPKGKYRRETTPVGQFPPNGFGLYDLHGNVWEWCLDDWHENYKGAPDDGSAWLDNQSSINVLRGGSWVNDPQGCRSALRYRSGRDDSLQNFGFRVCCGSGRTL